MEYGPHADVPAVAPADEPPSEIDRRAFLRRAAVATTAGFVGTKLGVDIWHQRSSLPWDPAVFPPPGSARVAVVRATSYDRSLLEGTVLDGLRAIHADLAGKRVVLKPNMVEFDPGSVIDTDPSLVAAAAVAATRLGAASVVVGEGPGHRRDTQYVVTASGLLAALRETRTPFVDLNTDAVVPVRLRSAYTALGSLYLPRTISDADVVISMPKMKTHHWAGVTLSLKNCFGCVPSRVYGWPKNALHWAGLSQSILDVAAAVRPRYAIVDGIVGMQGNGPISGTPVNAGLLVFADDPVAADVTATRLMGFDPQRVSYLTEAGRFLGQADPDRITQVGEDVERSAVGFQTIPEFSFLRAG